MGARLGPCTLNESHSVQVFFTMIYLLRGCILVYGSKQVTGYSCMDADKHTPLRKAVIPRALREQVWIKAMGSVFQGKCLTAWCKNKITVFDFHCGHCVPESKGGATTIDNLLPICSRCNLSMGSQYTIQEWSRMFQPPPRSWSDFFRCCFISPPNRHA